MNNIILGRGRGISPRIDIAVIDSYPGRSLIGRGRGGPAGNDTVDRKVDPQQSIIGSGDPTRINATIMESNPQKSVIGRGGPARLLMMAKTDESPIIGRGRATLQKNSNPVSRLGEKDRSDAQRSFSPLDEIDEGQPEIPGLKSYLDWNAFISSSNIIDHDQPMGQEERLAYIRENTKPELDALRLQRKLLPLLQDARQWTIWPTLKCNEDFLNFPPLLQMQEQCSPERRFWKIFRCRTCNWVCPPPVYSCTKGHVLCFSCTSVQKASTCPILVPKENNAERVPCKVFLKPSVQKRYIDDYLAHSKIKYGCPFQRVGCDQSKTLLPQDVVEHAQKQCPYRYTIKCFIPGCDDDHKRIRVGFYKEHCVTIHGSRIIELKNHSGDEPLEIPYEVHENSNQRISIPILFVEQLDAEIIFALVMMRTGMFVYFWIYQVAALEGSLEPFHTRLVLHIKKNLNDAFCGKALEKQNVNHDISVSIEDVVKSGNLMNIDIRDFFDRYLMTNQEEGNLRREISGHFYLLNVNILRDLDKASLPPDIIPL